MALTLNNVVDGPRRVVTQIQIDDTSGDEAGTAVIDLSALTPAPVALTIERVTANIVGFSATLEFDHTTDTLIIALADGDSVDFVWRGASHAGPGADGWKDTGTPGDGTGDVIITTTGNLAGDAGTIQIVAKKEF